jgi:predicted phage tail protein
MHFVDQHLWLIPFVIGNVPLVMLGTKTVLRQVRLVQRSREHIESLQLEMHQLKSIMDSTYERIRRLEEQERQRKVQDQHLEEERQRAQAHHNRELIQFTEIGLLDERII